MIGTIFIIILAAAFAVNMGGGNFAASFAAAYGGKILSRKKAQVLFGIFVFLGAVFLGHRVAGTLSDKIIPRELLTADTIVIIFLTTTICLFAANLLGVPQSTSMVTVAAIAGIGLYFKRIFLGTFLYLVPVWILLPVTGYVLTYFFGRMIYPSRKSNFWVYEKLVNQVSRLKMFVVAASCYNAFSVGANNVANVAGPLSGAGLIGTRAGLAMAAPVFGIGSVVFHKALTTTGKKIVPLGLLTSTIICLVTGTLMIIASVLGIPQSFVMIKVACVFAVGGLKDGHRTLMSNPITKKTYISWLATPILSIILSYFLVSARYALFK